MNDFSFAAWIVDPTTAHQVCVPGGCAPGSTFRCNLPPVAPQKRSIWSDLQRAASDVGRAIDKGVKSAKDEFHTVKTQCPQCQAVVQLGPQHSREKFFTCPSCGAVVATPTSSSKVNYHSSKASDSLNTNVSKALGWSR